MPVNRTRRSRGRELGVDGRAFGSVGKARTKSRSGVLNKTLGDAEEVLEAEGSGLLAEKQDQLDSVLDRHDTLVREMFHMEHFLMMIHYDPQEAKKDKTVVFQNYEAMYDLVDKAAPGPSRSTRRTRTEQIQSLKAPSISAPQRLTSPHKNLNTKTTTALWEHLDGNSRSKGKGKGKALERHVTGDVVQDHGEAGDEQQESISVMLAPRRSHKREKMAHAGKAPVTEQQIERSALTNGHVAESISVGSRRSGRLKGPGTESDLPPLSGTAPTVHRHVTQVRPSPLPVNLNQFLHKPTPLSPSSTIPRRRTFHEIEPNSISAPPTTPKFNVKRLKLLLRRPPPPVTNPRQRPLPPRYNSSVTSFLSSYFTLNGEDVDEKAFRRQVETDAAVLERTDQFRKQGRFIPGTDTLFGFNVENQPSFTTPERTSKDHWDHVVEAALYYSALRRKRTSGQQIAGQIASKIRAYWDGQEARKDKLRQQEERRLRALAKATIRMVTNEWKKAVFHIREQERLTLEAEEVRRGHEHLDAILDQSGYLLETQQSDLTRGGFPRSRSSSVSLTLRGWGSEVDEDEDEEDEEQEEGEVEEGAGDDEKAEGGEEEEEGEETEGEEGEEPEGQREAGSGGSKNPDDASDKGNPSDFEDSADTHMLLDSPVIPPTPASVHSSLMDISDAAESVRPHSPTDGDMSDDDFKPEDPSGAAADEAVNAELELPSLLPSPAPEPQAEPTSDTQISVSDTPPLHSSPLLMPQDHILSTLPSPHHLHSIPLPHADNSDMFEEDLTPRQPSELSHDTPEPVSPATPDGNLPDLHTEKGPKHLQPSSPRHSTDSSLPDASHTHSSKSPSISPVQDLISCGSGASPHSDNRQAVSNLLTDTSPDAAHGTSDATALKDTSEVQEHDISEIDDDATRHSPSPEREPQLDEDETEAIPDYLKPYAVAPVKWDPDAKIHPLLLRGDLRPYQQSGLEWLASLHTNNLNGILADEMGLGKTIQTIALLAHLACDRGIWGPHLIVVPTSVLLNWEMEFKKFLPGFKVLSYHGSTKRRKELRQGWNDKHHFNVCITSYTLASRDAHIFKRKAWYYMVLDEAHMIKNFKSQRWNILLMFRSFRRLLLTGTPLQNNLTELWALLQFLMSGANFANLKEFGEWFSNPLEKAIEMGNVLDDETMARVTKLHTVLRPYLLRRLKRDVEKELPSKYEHLVMCPLSKRQRFLYDEFMSRAHTRDALQSGVYQNIANILMQLRKVCNHPDLFEVRPIVTSFAMTRSAIADFEIKELLVRRQMINGDIETVNLELLGLQFIDRQNKPLMAALESRRLDATSLLPHISEIPGEPPPKDTRTIAGFRKYSEYLQRANTIARWSHIGYLNRLRCNILPIYSSEVLSLASRFSQPIVPISAFEGRRPDWEGGRVLNSMVKSYETRAEDMAGYIDRFAFATPAVVALDMPRITLSGCEAPLTSQSSTFDDVLHRATVKLQIAFPDPSLLQYDCGKLQELARLLREKKAGGHRILIFTQMTRILDILEIFLNFHGYLYLRLDGATKIEDRQYITERFNSSDRVFCFIASSRSGGVGINLTGADTVVFYDSDFNPQMDRQCEDRAHRIGQIRDVHIYRFVSQHTVEEALLRKANQKRSLDDLVIQKGEFDWRSLFKDEGALSKALEEFEDTEDVHAAAFAATEEVVMQGADEADFGGDMGENAIHPEGQETPKGMTPAPTNAAENEGADGEEEPIEEEEGGSIVEYMIATVQRDYEFFREWRM
ncbi:Helicase SWR1 [Hypsizygus marmoreus]|uniref:Helicase SWR1 n=1 Tax=Hypsizygus marmoreus TaxID=39966 RepID=A0A369JXS7_HYPMA|nr:Helicase SWR1 [Hypsizygus marmoreus]